MAGLSQVTGRREYKDVAKLVKVDPRKKRRGHRRSAKRLLSNGGVFNNYSAPGSSFWCVAQWHLKRARNG